MSQYYKQKTKYWVIKLEFCLSLLIIYYIYTYNFFMLGYITHKMKNMNYVQEKTRQKQKLFSDIKSYVFLFKNSWSVLKCVPRYCNTNDVSTFWSLSNSKNYDELTKLDFVNNMFTVNLTVFLVHPVVFFHFCFY